jgi:hypothetical protein
VVQPSRRLERNSRVVAAHDEAREILRAGKCAGRHATRADFRRSANHCNGAEAAFQLCVHRHFEERLQRAG